MLIKQVNGNTFDLFFNQGWDNWARFTKENNKLRQISGVSVPQNIIHYLQKKHGVA
jgi:hypothetical protein